MNELHLMYPNASFTKVGETFVDYLQQVKGVKEGLNGISHSLKWAKVYYGGLSDRSNRLLQQIDDAKAVFIIQKGALSIQKFAKHCAELRNSQESRLSVVKKLFLDSLELAGVSKEVLKFVDTHDIFKPNPQTMGTLGALGTCSLIIGPGQGVYTNFDSMSSTIQKIKDPALENSERVFLKAKAAKMFTTLVVSTSYVSMGIIMAAKLTFDLKVAGWVTLALSTNAFVFGLSGYFHEKLSVLTAS